MSLTESQLSSLPVHWCATARRSEDCDSSHRGLAKELAIELSVEHPLYGTPVEVVAHDVAYDDILCQHVSDPRRFAVVHLTMAGKPESFGSPSIDFDGTWDDFMRLQQAISDTLAVIDEEERLGLRDPMTGSGTSSPPKIVQLPPDKSETIG